MYCGGWGLCKYLYWWDQCHHHSILYTGKLNFIIDHPPLLCHSRLLLPHRYRSRIIWSRPSVGGETKRELMKMKWRWLAGNSFDTHTTRTLQILHQAVKIKVSSSLPFYSVPSHRDTSPGFGLGSGWMLLDERKELLDLSKAAMMRMIRHFGLKKATNLFYNAH